MAKIVAYGGASNGKGTSRHLFVASKRLVKPLNAVWKGLKVVFGGVKAVLRGVKAVH